MTRRALAALATATAVAVVPFLPAAPAQGADTWTVPGKASITIRGHGYGHGHGMSQHGAEGAARQGLDHRRILAFYYPRTKVGSVGGSISVLVTADTTDDLVVVARKGLTLRDSGTGKQVPLPDNGATLWRVQPSAAGDRVAYYDKRWHDVTTLTGYGEFAAGSAPVTLVTPSGRVDYRGRLRAVPVKPGSNQRDTVNVTSLENYVRGVVPREVPATWSPAAVRAQAVAARTYAAYERAHPRSSRFHVYDDTRSQVYGGATSEHPASDRAVRATRREVRTYRGEPAFTQFSSSSGGWSSAGSMPYLVAQRDPYDGWSGNPHHSWRVRVTDAKVEKAFPGVGNLRRIVVTRREGHGQWGGRVVSLRLVGSQSTVTTSGDTFRFELGLRSEWVTFAVSRR